MGFLMAGLMPSTPQPASSAAAASSPLGRFADIVTATVSVGVIAAAVLSHLQLVGHADAFIDSVALIAVGVLYGTARGVVAGRDTTIAAMADQVNANTAAFVARADLNTAVAEAAHKRLDALGAPAAAVDHTGLVAGDPSGKAVRP